MDIVFLTKKSIFAPAKEPLAIVVYVPCKNQTKRTWNN